MRKGNCCTRGESFSRKPESSFRETLLRAPQSPQEITCDGHLDPSSPVYDSGVRVHRSYTLRVGFRVREKRTAARAGSAPPRGRCRRQKVIFLNHCSGNEAPRARPDETTKCGGRGLVSRGDRYGSRSDRKRFTEGTSADALKRHANHQSSHVKAKYKFWPHLQARMLP